MSSSLLFPDLPDHIEMSEEAIDQYSDKYMVHINNCKCARSVGKARKAAIESIDKKLYKDKSTMYSFKMAPNNVLLWIVALGLRYRDQPEYVTEWTNYKSQDENLDTIEAIFLQVCRKETGEKLVTIKLYITTLTLTIQGKNIKCWADTEFKILREFVYANQNGHNEEHNGYPLKADEFIETNHNDSIFSPLNSDNESDDDTLSEIIEQLPLNQQESEPDLEQTRLKTIDLSHSEQPKIKQLPTNTENELDINEQTNLKSVCAESRPVPELFNNSDKHKNSCKVIRKDNQSSKTAMHTNCGGSEQSEQNIDLSKFNESLNTIKTTIHSLESQITELISSSTLIHDLNDRLKTVENEIKSNCDIEKRLTEIETKTGTCTSQDMNNRLTAVESQMKANSNILEQLESKTCTCTSQELLSSVDRKFKAVEINSNRTQQHVSSFDDKLQEMEVQLTNRSQMLEDKIRMIENKEAQTSSANKDFIEYLKKENNELKNQNSMLKSQNDRLLLEKSKENCTTLQENRSFADTALSDRTLEPSLRNDKIPTPNMENSYSKGASAVVPNDQNGDRDELVYVKTSNRFDPLLSGTGSVNKSQIDINNPNSTRDQAERKDKPKLNIIIDSQGNLLDGTKMYKHMEVKINVLGQGQKNIKGARSHISQQYYTKQDHVIIGVGSNDLTNRHPDWCTNEMELLIKDLRLQVPETNIHILPAFERLNNDPFNQDVNVYNEKIKLLCAKHGIKYIQNNSINTTNTHLYRDDGIHLNMKGCIALVRLIKTHMNTSLNMKPYEEYKVPGKQRLTQNRNASGPRKQSGQPNLLENFIKLLLKNN